jgi:hypothetical protein
MQMRCYFEGLFERDTIVESEFEFDGLRTITFLNFESCLHMLTGPLG